MPSPAFPFRKSIATVSLSGTLPEKLEAAAAAGFDGVELFEHDLLTFDGTPADVRRIVRDLGLEITLFQPFRDFEGMPDALRERALARAERKFDLMQELGTGLVLVCSNTQEHALPDPARAAADLAEMAERAARRGLRVGFEALAWGRHINRWRQAWEIVRRADHPALGLILDSFHTLSVGDTLDGLEDVSADKLAFVQLADAPRLSMDALSWSRHYRNFPGQGELPVVAFTRKVIDCGYRGPLSLEVFNDEFRAAPARQTAMDGLRSLIWLEAECGADTLPAPPRFGGVEFLEFAVDYRTGLALAAQVKALGFRHAGRHRSKAVDLYRQGSVNLILNSEQDSAAAEHFALHGPSVCAIGLRVDDARRALARARALLCREWQERIGANERRIPALRTPDGMLMYLVDGDGPRTIYDDDFVLKPPPAAGESGNEPPYRLDHIAQALPAHRMDTFVLFYRAVLGLQPLALQEIPDPYGLVRSRAMVSADGALRLPLSVSESGRTSTGRLVSAYAGAGIQHIALGTPRILETLADVVQGGARLLHIPENYYDDLEARHPLSAEQVEALRDAAVLYDRDTHGEFLHAYTVPFHDRFFFELVQRDGYAGFGAANAAVRMAAQAAMTPYRQEA
ncbi:bifunctional sugar phosphate isomerase/epimerase/4-hydroxyphenylpyruvate dioxygenase family protein [Ralstonia pseudosolanacearum]|uniref:bifunctional sugar phosphate isomerase/epimerase/4-hydroxyphenylpyruvate dioxygenase family protein n=1 Tax=Ralstonia pseudosolanacearum TaxID=1310165 RepID=UPI00267473A7|nr:bifunctional sugar phosphate isomerase/epimerase/4-hydroxyphenylpyruvate dioxygenase family protein [Ralstonia pseudosolanacearum]MDO3509487.1 bifunctional sugar phosphate isomerase/epimerase/4-hydroxyphenylpyruvate dioxygenase family protein [Ralstonia pseudosolanacearum]MDO3514501.1 bifunctional sugar phosphate isomerase/epimerase/4-hydroxyphenylpyruvate dioxygenase family protein [Ralstonia pseudosolanacearum]MDO3608858.1 bifunctional sugar phosphate isomerase/epimerase/4-hydroxyphenylpyru